MVFIIFYTVMSITQGNEFAVIYISIIFVFFSILPSSLMAYDNKNNWNSFVSATPISDRVIVGSKFLLQGVLMLFGFLLAMFYRAVVDPNIELSIIAPIISASFIFGLIQFPIQYRLGVERGRIVTMAMLFLPVMLILILYKSNIISLDMISPALIQNLPYVLLAVFAVMIPLSYFLPLFFFKKNIQKQ